MNVANLNKLGINLEELKQNCDKLFNKKSVNEISSWDYEELDPFFKNIVQIFKNHFNLKEKITLRKLRIERNTNKSYNSEKLPYIPHIDFNRCLKFMIYFNDIDQNNGCIHISHVNPNLYEEKRLKLKPNKDSNKTYNNHITDLKKESYLPMTGKAGDIIFFDTNQPHYGGNFLSKSDQRFILRIDFVNKDWKYPFLKKKSILEKIFSLFQR